MEQNSEINERQILKKIYYNRGKLRSVTESGNKARIAYYEGRLDELIEELEEIKLTKTGKNYLDSRYRNVTPLRRTAPKGPNPEIQDFADSENSEFDLADSDDATENDELEYKKAEKLRRPRFKKNKYETVYSDSDSE